MNISRINNTPTQHFTGNYKNAAKSTILALTTATALLTASQKSDAQNIEFPPIQPGALPTEDWYSMYQRQRDVHGVVSYIDQFGQKFVDETDYVNLQIKYEQLMKNKPKSSRSIKQTKKLNTPISAEHAKSIAELEHKSTHNLLTLGALVLGFLFGPGISKRIINKVIK